MKVIPQISVPEEEQKSSTLTDDQARMIAKLLIDLEERNGKPQDFEWAFEDGSQLYQVFVISLLMYRSTLLPAGQTNCDTSTLIIFCTRCPWLKGGVMG